MKKLLATSVACLTFLGASPLMAKSTAEKDKVDLQIAGVLMTATLDGPCMQAATKKRDTALVDAFNAYNQSITNALHVRMDAQVAAWAKVDTNERAIAIKASEKVFASSYNEASLKLLKAKNSIRKTFSDGLHDCWKAGSSSSTTSSATSSSTTSASTSSATSSSQSSVACKEFSGKLSGAYTIAVTQPDVGRTVNITATGSVTDVGSVSADGWIKSLGFVAMGNATGTITLHQGTSSAILHLQGPLQTGFSRLPETFSFTLSDATGVFASYNQSKGKVSLQLKGDSNGSLKLTFNGQCNR